MPIIRVRLTGALVGTLALISIATAAAFAADYQWHLPPWLPPPTVPAENPMSVEKVELGRRLFYDRRLSANEEFSCASCHQQARAFTDGRRVARGATGERHPRNTPSLANVGYLSRLTWANPHHLELEDQLLVPLFGIAPIELGMGGKEKNLVEALRRDEAFRQRFQLAFPNAAGDFVTIRHIRMAIASFERTMISANSPYDRFRYLDDQNAISESARRGADLFFSERLQCFQCHGGFHFTDTYRHVGLPLEEFAFHNTGLYNLAGTGRYPALNTGLHAKTGRAVDMGRFKTPSLRNVAVTAPYMHDGSVLTLGAVIDIYAAGGRNLRQGRHFGDGRTNSQKSSFVTGFTISRRQRYDLISFLESLTDEAFLTSSHLADPLSTAVHSTLP